MEDNRAFSLGAIGIVVLIALLTWLFNGCVSRDLTSYRGGIPQGFFVRYELVEQTDSYRLYKAEDGRTHRIERPQPMPTKPDDDMPIKIGTMIL